MNVLREFHDDPALLARLVSGIGPVRSLQDNAADFVRLYESALEPAASAGAR
jgi:hypothetical protein